MGWQKSLTLIVALTLSRGIGLKNDLPWKLKSDMMFFSRVTSGLLVTRSTGQMNVVLMGRKTWESLPAHSRPLKNRINVVISRQEVLDLGGGAYHARSLDDALALLSQIYDSTSKIQLNRVFVIGGGELYKAAMEHSRLNRIIATVIHNEVDCDVFFPIDFRSSQSCLPWRKQDHSVLEAWVGSKVPQGKINENGFIYEFEMWIRDI
uniref:Dihydrofolate reductase n=1 Tax=Pneumocystis jirovecii TaxID=42068 RepID=A0EPY1_PNEJI|nr:DHFR [Pneumocystis jirovecii]